MNSKMQKNIDSLLKDILPVIQDFDRERDFVNQNYKNMDKSSLDVHLRYQKYLKNFASILKKYSLIKIKNPTGEEFDPKLHNAVYTEKNPLFEEGQIIKLISNGYKKNGKILKYCDVVVNKL